MISLRHFHRMVFLAALASVAMITGVLPLRAVELRGVPTAVATGEGVEVSWYTDSLCGTRIAYGKKEGQQDEKVEGQVGLFHKVTLKNLNPGSTYYLHLGTSKKWIANATLTLGTDGQVNLSESPDITAVDASISAQSATQAEPSSGSPSKSLTKSEPKPLPKLEEASEPKSATPSAKVKESLSSARSLKAPPTVKTWGYMPSLQDHFDRHGADFKCSSPDDYAAKAWLFLQYAKQNSLPMKWDDSDNTLRIWEPKSRAFAAFNRDGTTKTFFRPSNPSYWSRQPGRPITPAKLPF